MKFECIMSFTSSILGVPVESRGVPKMDPGGESSSDNNFYIYFLVFLKEIMPAVAKWNRL